MSELEELAVFYRRTGRPATILAGGVWVTESRLSVVSVPGCRPLRPHRAEAQHLLERTGRTAAVFACADPTGLTAEAWFVRDRNYGLHSLQKQFRQQLRAAQKICVCRPVEWEQLRAEGLPVNQAAARRRGAGHRLFLEPAAWSSLCTAAQDVTRMEVMGCFVAGVLAAYLTTWTHEGVCYGLHMHWDDRFRSVHPTHALYYATVRERMAREDVRCMTVGRLGNPALLSVDTFKRHAGFKCEPLQLGAVLHPRVAKLFENRVWRGAWAQMRQRLGHRWPRLHHSEVFDAAAATSLPSV